MLLFLKVKINNEENEETMLCSNVCYNMNCCFYDANLSINLPFRYQRILILNDFDLSDSNEILTIIV